MPAPAPHTAEHTPEHTAGHPAAPGLPACAPDGLDRRFPPWLDTTACESRARALLASNTGPQAADALPLAWVLRQADSRLAAALAQAVLGGRPGRVDTACARLVLAEAHWLDAEPEAAEAQLRLAGSLLDPERDHRALSDLHWLCSQLASESGQGARRDEAIAASIVHATAAGDALRAAQGRLAQACVLAMDEQPLPDAALHEAQQALRADDPGLRMLAHLALQHHATHQAMHDAPPGVADGSALTHGERAMAEAMACGQWRRAILTGCNLGLELFERGSLDAALARLDATLPLARRCGWPLPLASLLQGMANCLLGLDRPAAAADLAREACALTQRLPRARTRLLGLVALADALRLLSGGADEARAGYAQVLAEARAAQDTSMLRCAEYGLACLHEAAGDGAGAAPLVAAALQRAQAAGDVAHAMLCLRLQARLAATVPAWAGPAPRALLAQALELLPALPGTAQAHGLLAELAQAAEAEGDTAAASAHWRAAYAALAQQRNREFNDRAAVMEVRLRTEQALARASAEHERSLTDPLTQLRNRRFFEQVIEACAAEAQAPGARGELLLFMIDLDHFKAVNDTHGHAAGDAVLVQCAQRLRGVARAHDHLVRWGGEEFVLLLRSGSRHDAPAVAQRLLQAVAGQAFELPGGQALPLTCSVGWCAFPPDPSAPGPAPWHEALQRADAHLFEAKRAGRNRAVG